MVFLVVVAVALAAAIIVVATRAESDSNDQTSEGISDFTLQDALAEVCVQGTYVDGDAPILRNAETAGNCRGAESYVYVGTYSSEFLRDNDITEYVGSYALAQGQDSGTYALIATNSGSPSTDLEPLADKGWTVVRR